jgi:hypothetical protein
MLDNWASRLTREGEEQRGRGSCFFIDLGRVGGNGRRGWRRSGCSLLFLPFCSTCDVIRNRVCVTVKNAERRMRR